MQCWVTRDNGLNENLIYLAFQLFDIMAFFCELLVDRSERSLVTDVHVLIGIVKDEIWTFLVHCVIRQMHKSIL